MIRQRRKVIYLLGFMGSGKSTVGNLLAKALGWPLIDLDTVIEAGQNLSIREIFEHFGEAFFRQIEHAALMASATAEPSVIALGGGTFAQPPNIDLIRESGGTTVWLDCPPELLRVRCEGMEHRPLFRDEQSFTQLFLERVAYYRLADFRISTEGRKPEEVVEQILSLHVF
jgi:shikimate kinase